MSSSSEQDPAPNHDPAQEESSSPDSSQHDVSMTQEPPRTLVGTLRRLGPGLIIAGSIVGSGELIATTKTGAVAGISLLWLVVVGCVIKIFVQIELGRYTISTGETTLRALNSVPGPKAKINWIVAFWILMMLASIGQLGGIIAGVGQALAIAMPISRGEDGLGDYQRAIALPSEGELKRYLKWSDDKESGGSEFAQQSELQQERITRGLAFLNNRFEASPELAERADEAIAAVRKLTAAQQRLESIDKSDSAARAESKAAVDEAQAEVNTLLEPGTRDDKIWAAIVALLTIGLLFRGKYSVVQNISTVLVVGFTFLTLGNVFALQSHEEFRLTAEDFLKGFGLPEKIPGVNPLGVALATFGIIGVGATELVAYPYWCIEKGYARFTGPPSEDEGWVQRARGWIRVMYADAFLSMLVYTVATLAFFIMGVAVLYRQGLDPDGMRMVSTLLQQYVPVFGAYAHWLFLLGAIAVLYSTFMVATASHARLYTDFAKVVGWMDPRNERAHHLSISFFCVLIPLVCLGIFWTGLNPVALVLLGGFMQAVMLPLLAFAALYFRYTKTDRRLLPGRAWDIFLILSCLGLLISGTYTVWDKVVSTLLENL